MGDLQPLQEPSSIANDDDDDDSGSDLEDDPNDQ